MKLLLIQPPFTIFKTETKTCHPPLGLAYLAAVLKERHDIFVLDALAEGYEKEEVVDKNFLRFGLSAEDIKRRIEQIMPDVVGVSCLFSSQSENVFKICELSKKINKNIITILGGAHPSAVPEIVLENKNVDFVVIGEGEETIARLLDCLENKKYSFLQDIEGVGFKYEGIIRISRKKKFNENIDNLPLPYWDIFPLERYFKINNPHGGPARNTPFLPVITSRGCPFECIFCSVHNLWGIGYRTRSAQNIISEIDYLINKFGIKELLFEDDNLTLDKERAKQLFKGMIERRMNVSWNVPNGIAVQTLDEEILYSMKKSGCYRISIGIESGSERVLKDIIKKPIMLMKIKPIIDKAKQLGLDTGVFFVVGLPGEKREDLKKTFRFARYLDVDNVNFFFATPLPGTRLFKICEEKGLIRKPYDYTKFKSDCPNFSTGEFSIPELDSIVIKEKIKILFLYLLRNPKKFIVKFYNKIKNKRKTYA